MNKVTECKYPSDFELSPDKNCVLFDMDGTILNSEPIHAEALQKILKSITTTQYSKNYLNNKYHGKTDHEVYDNLGIKKHTTADHFIKEKNELMIKLISILTKSELKKILAPGIVELFKELKKRGIKIGIVSAGEKDIVHNLIEKCNLTQYLDLIVSRSDTFNSKPSSSPYLRAMRQLKSTAKNTTIFEDSTTGLLAAKQTGAEVVKVNWASQ